MTTCDMCGNENWTCQVCGIVTCNDRCPYCEAKGRCSFDDFLHQRGLGMDAYPGAAYVKDPDGWGESKPDNNWRVVLYYKGKTFETDFYGGLAVTNPTAADVVSSLFLDAHGWDDSESFEDFCDMFGFDPDSRKAERIYNACGTTANRLRWFFGDEYEVFQQEAQEH